VKQTPVFMNENQQSAVRLLSLFVLPGVALAGGIAAVLRRRAAK